ncbi:SPAC23H3.12c: Uncharacterized protein C23H3.12c [Gossypium arboreum]|uniref:SPAC23H3.12c: Uncharacterized protein C23H3.12c n=1 Tax=Gossypium arboreum TaxID=29729 RepID=A0A0B0NAD6_GOSAR|nr:SPAC23H3.12c: Uncharacterized protein C23H3.12c [Gossypium arboreum]
MKARLVVFPIKGKIWCFSRSIDQSASAFNSANTPSTVKELWKKISTNSKPLNANAELLVDFISNKMNNAWVGLEKAPEGSFKNKLHGFGLQLLARVKPSEILLKSISKEARAAKITTYSHEENSGQGCVTWFMAFLRGTVLHRKYFYGSVTLLPLTAALAVLPLPNIPFFWVLFRTYSHWRALQGSEKLLQLVSDNSRAQSFSSEMMEASKELEELLRKGYENGSVNEKAISDICIKFKLNKIDVLKWRDLV